MLASHAGYFSTKRKLMRGLIFGDMMFLMIGIGGNVKSIIFTVYGMINKDRISAARYPMDKEQLI